MPMFPTAMPNNSQMPNFFFTLSIALRSLLCRSVHYLRPLVEVVWRNTVCKIHQRHVKRHVVFSASRRYTAEEVGTYIRQVAAYLCHLLACFLFKAKHSPHSLSTGVFFAVYLNLDFLHVTKIV